MDKVIINTQKAPAAIGPYSQAVKVGNLMFISGQIPCHRRRGERGCAGSGETMH